MRKLDFCSKKALQSGLLLIVLTLTPWSAFSQSLVENPFLHFKNFLKNKQTVVFKIEKDLNADGVSDFLLANAAKITPNGGPWKVYLTRSDGRYDLVEQDFIFHPSAIHFKGKNRVIVFRRAQPLEGDLVEVVFNQGEMKEVKRKPFRMNSDSSRNRFKQLFGSLFKSPVHRSCAAKLFLKGECVWK